ncbi:MAG TPA: Fur family transcriptional regulator [Smithella sp.]|nr:Fur family transcriptional regulator [Smithella sp.]
MVANSKNTDALLTLQKAGISKTSQRLAVLNILLEAATPQCVNTIRQSLKTRASIDKVTVYRILSLFRQHGIIREIASAGPASYFEMVTLENPMHPHFSCRNCGAFICMAPQPFTKMPDLILSEDEYSIEHIEINISGLCSDCRFTTKPESQKQYYKDGK